jgi:hypothetical protein
LQARPLQIAAGEAAIIIARSKGGPALMRLALDIGLGGLALIVE